LWVKNTTSAECKTGILVVLVVMSSSGLSHDSFLDLNLICHMHSIMGVIIMGVIISCDLLLNWVGIYLYLVTANKIFDQL
jgi:hypothetical protein